MEIKNIIVCGIRVELKERIGVTPAGAEIRKCTVHDTISGQVGKQVAFIAKDGTCSITSAIPEWIKTEYNYK